MKFNVLDMNLYASKKSFFILLVFLFYYSVKIKIETSWVGDSLEKIQNQTREPHNMTRSHEFPTVLKFLYA